MRKKLSLLLSGVMLFTVFSKFDTARAAENNYYINSSYSCDFESYTGTSGWYGDLQIVPNGAVCSVSDVIEGNGIRFSDVKETTPYIRYNKLNAKERLKISFDIYFDSVPQSGYIATNGITATGGTRYMNNIFIADGTMKFYNGNDVEGTFTLSEKTKYSIEYEINNVQKVYSVRINGNTAADNYKLYRNDAISFNDIRIGMGYSTQATGIYSMDNFSCITYEIVEIRDILRFNDFRDNLTGITTEGDTSEYTVKNNSCMKLKGKSVLSIGDITFSNIGLAALRLKKTPQTVAEVVLNDGNGNEILLASSSQTDLWGDEWNEFIFEIDLLNSNINIYNNTESVAQSEFTSDFDFENCALKVKCSESELICDDILLFPDNRLTNGIITVFETGYVGDKGAASEYVYAGDYELGVTIYDNRDEKKSQMLTVHKQDNKIKGIFCNDFVYNNKVAKAQWCSNIQYKRNDTIDVYLWTSASELIPLDKKMQIMHREQSKLYPEEAEYAYLKLNSSHPYIAVDKEDIKKVKQIYNSDDTSKDSLILKSYINTVIKKADELLAADFYDENSKYFLGYKDTVDYVLSVAGNVMEYNENLGLAYLITGNEEYAKCIYKILHITGSSEENKNVKYPDWTPSHYLDTAQMCAAFAVGYDWAYEGLTEEERTEIENSIYEYGVLQGLYGYRNDAAWASYKNNWGMICNSGMLLGALAIAKNPQYSKACFEVAAEAVTHLENVIDLFNEDGVWQESIGYGKSSLACLIRAIDTLKSALGNDYGLLSATGLSKTAEPYIYLDGPVGIYNFHDAAQSVSHINAPETMWIGREFENDGFVEARKNVISKKLCEPTARDVIWYTKSESDTALDLDKYFNVIELFALREKNDDTNALWVAAQAGKNNIDHSHLDCGSFVLDWGGYRWAMDLGYDDYNLNGYFGRERYNYYRVRAEGHNTLVINPSADRDQKISADTKVEKFVSNDDYAFAIIDLTSAYDAQRVRRGIQMSDSRKSIVIRDELELNSSNDIVYWYMHTDANINIVNNFAYLTKGEKEMQLEFLAEDCEAVIEAVDAKPLIKIDGTENENPNIGIKKIRIKLSSGQSPKLTVKITPVGLGNKFSAINTVKELDRWE